MDRSARRAALAVLGMVALATTACQPPPPRLALEVTTAANGSDDVPGDGVCASAAAGGACTLQAAIDEGNTASVGADLTVPADVYADLDLVITGDIRINSGTPQLVTLEATTVVVEVGGRLEAQGINTQVRLLVPFGLQVRGAAVMRRSVIGSLAVEAGGSAVLSTSAVVTSSSNTSAITNAGTIIAVSSSMLAYDQVGSGQPLASADGAVAHLASSVLARPDILINGGGYLNGGGGSCSGVPPTSHGHLFVEEPCGSATATGDASGLAGTNIDLVGTELASLVSVFTLDQSSPLVDAIPLGDPACDVTAFDLYGNPRGVDGNGDGIGGCDIGAIERPAND